MDVVEKIQKVKTNKQDRPEKDVKIISMTVVEE
jgi:cyclophilin family peptidyl-prolyl cis-trans isomerase